MKVGFEDRWHGGNDLLGDRTSNFDKLILGGDVVARISNRLDVSVYY